MKTFKEYCIKESESPVNVSDPSVNTSAENTKNVELPDNPLWKGKSKKKLPEAVETLMVNREI